MTRNELIEELETLIIGTPKMSDVMAAVDQYVATDHHQIEQQVATHVDTRLAAERELIAQDIEAQAPVQLDASSGYQALRAGMIRAAAIVRGAES